MIWCVWLSAFSTVQFRFIFIMNSMSQNTFSTHPPTIYWFLLCYGPSPPCPTVSTHCRLSCNSVTSDSSISLKSTCTFSTSSGDGSCTAPLLVYWRRNPSTWKSGPSSSSAYWKNVHDVAQGTNDIVCFHPMTSARISCSNWGPRLFWLFWILPFWPSPCHLGWIKF